MVKKARKTVPVLTDNGYVDVEAAVVIGDFACHREVELHHGRYEPRGSKYVVTHVLTGYRVLGELFNLAHAKQCLKDIALMVGVSNEVMTLVQQGKPTASPQLRALMLRFVGVRERAWDVVCREAVTRKLGASRI